MILDVRALMVVTLPTMLLMAAARSGRCICIFSGGGRSSKLTMIKKGCRKESRGTKGQLLIDKAVMNDWMKRHTNLGMVWVDYKKAYNMIPQFLDN